MASSVLTCLLFVLNILFVAGENGCPDAEDIAPCSCIRRPTVRLICADLESSGLDAVFTNSERYTYQEVHIENSSLLYIPSNIFEKVVVKELYLKNVTLQTLFSDTAPKNLDLYKLQLESTTVMRTIVAQNLSQFTNLKQISLYKSAVSVLPKNYGLSLPRNIKTIILHETNTKSISKGALLHAPNLDKLAVESGNLKTLLRDSFPRPYYGRILNFNDNKITAIPEDFFTEMPNLQFLSMMNNAISVIPETAFAGRTLNVPYFRFEGNPLQCDCQLLWILKDKPEILGGTCYGPEKFKGRDFQDLIPAEFDCEN